jgi:lysozyme
MTDPAILLLLLLLAQHPEAPDVQVPPSIDIARDLVAEHEGLSLGLYRDPNGRDTAIGYGRNLSTRGINELEAKLLLEGDLFDAWRWAKKLVPGWEHLNPVRRAVCIDLIYNLGPGGFASFKGLRAALGRQDYAAAAAEMRDSRWYRQVGRRGKRLARIMETGAL